MSEHTDNLNNVPVASKSLTNHIHIEWMNSFKRIAEMTCSSSYDACIKYPHESTL